MKQESNRKEGDYVETGRETDHYQAEYVHQFVEKWDEIIPWTTRQTIEGSFLIDVLHARGARRVLDVATGTGFHSVLLQKAGFEVTSADGCPAMLAQAFANGRQHGTILRAVQADWRWLSRKIDQNFDAVICLGNSFTHLFSENDRRKVLAEFYAMLSHDGILILDHRNYDAMLEHKPEPSHTYSYAGHDVIASAEYIDEGLVRFCYRFADNSVFTLNTFPLRKTYLKRLMKEVGFQEVSSYSDFQETFLEREPDFFIHVAGKTARTANPPTRT